MQPRQQGYLYAVLAFTLWGFFPFYFKEVTHIPPLEVLSNRIVWSFFSLIILLTLLRYWSRMWGLLRQRKYWLPLLLSTLFIATNWGVYIWSVTSNRIFEASLGYYINPLVNILLGFLVLKEQLRKVQWFAVLLATTGVAIQVLQQHELPWIALVLAFSFGTYGLIHKMLNVDSISSLFVETIILIPFVLIFLSYLALEYQGPALWSLSDWGLLLLAGPVTITPLLLFTAATKRINYATIGFLQYIVPSLLFLQAAFIYQEPFSLWKLVTFGCIWAALIIISIDAVKYRRLKRKNNG